MTPQDIWSAAYRQLELQLDRSTFDTWLRHAKFVAFDVNAEGVMSALDEGVVGVFVIGVHNAYACEMLQHRLYRVVRKVVSDIYGQPVALRFEVTRKASDKPPSLPDDAPMDMPLFQYLAQQSTLRKDEPHRHVDDPINEDLTYFDAEDTPSLPLHQVIKPLSHQEARDKEINPNLTFERFIVSQSNQMVFDAARAVADYPGNVYNPFLVYGGVGLGKTHILLAIANDARRRGLRALYMTSESFTNDLIDAIRNRTTAMFRDKYRSVDVLLIDDIQFITGKEATQEEFFHTFNALVNFDKQVVLASDRHPRELVLLEDRLRSRFEGGLVADIQPPEYETRLAILHMWSQEVQQERGVTLDGAMLTAIAQQGSTNVRELRGQFNKIVAQAQIGTLSASTIQDTLERYHQPRHHLTMRQVIEAVARVYGLQAQDLTGKKRTSRINQARQVAMYLVRELTEYSLPQIGEAFGGRTHTTILHGCGKVGEELSDDPILASQVNRIKHALIGD